MTPGTALIERETGDRALTLTATGDALGKTAAELWDTQAADISRGVTIAVAALLRKMKQRGDDFGGGTDIGDRQKKLPLLPDRDLSVRWLPWIDYYGPLDLNTTQSRRYLSFDQVLREARLGHGVAFAPCVWRMTTSERRRSCDCRVAEQSVAMPDAY